MEIVTYLCEFFFGSFWHWLGLMIVLCVIFPLARISVPIKKDDKEK